MFHSRLVLALFGALAVPGTVAAADLSFCEGYAEKAAEEAALAERLSCNFHGPRWTKDFEGHKAWCLGAQGSVVKAEAAARHNDVRLCMCEWYADRAAAQAATSAAQGCEFTGPRWTPDRSAHYRWCVLADVPLGTLESEIKTRDALLTTCAKP